MRGLARSAALWLTGRRQGFEEEVATRFVERRLRASGLTLGLYDPRSDTLRLPPGAAETMFQLRMGFIADAVPWMLKLGDRIPGGGLVIDVGGFRGITAQWFAQHVAQVIVFEPLPESALSIREVLRVRGISNVSVEELAVRDRDGTAEFFVYEMRGHNSLGKVDTSRYVHSVKVESTTLDDYAKAHAIDRVDFLKIDVEGFEYEVIKGAHRLLEERQIGSILFESNRPVLASLGKKAISVHELLASHSYVVTDLDGRLVESAEFEQLESADFLALPRAAYEDAARD
jgi:FkbM family methyltransferase